nr:MAG TPA: hypothetical protein [Caudoviricetes sp.]DAN66074.1 MAG TPA: hypothetical protein [Caudoviricetes sp.]DAY17187.1 MAG TPA: hypothetical protein [Caudoviricetes sp.]
MSLLPFRFLNSLLSLIANFDAKMEDYPLLHKPHIYYTMLITK